MIRFDRHIKNRAILFFKFDYILNKIDNMEKAEKIKQLLSNQFEQDLFEALLASLNDRTNKLRFNNFAYSIRE